MAWNDIFKKKTEDWIFTQIEKSSTDVEIKSNEEYISVTLKSLRIPFSREYFNTYYSTVHSHINMLHLGASVAEFNTVTKPASLAEQDPKRLYNVIQTEIPLLSHVPYRGGNISLEVGLFSIKANDLATSFLSVLGDMAVEGGVSFVNIAMPFAKHILKGINLLTGNDDSRLEIGISTSFAKLRRGIYALVKADRNNFDIKKYKLGVDGRLEDEQGKSLENYPYLILEISSSDSRPDWFTIPDIAKAHVEYRAAVHANHRTNAEDAFNSFRRIVRLSPDMIVKDALNIIKQVEAELNEMFSMSFTSATGKKTAKRLQDYVL